MSAVDSSQPATTKESYANVKSAVEAGDVEAVKIRLSCWRSNPSIDGPSPEQINYLVPRAAEGEGQPQVLEYLLSIGGNMEAQAILLAASPAIFRIFIAHGWKVENSLLFSRVRRPDLIAFFLSEGAEMKATSRGGFSPLDIAALHGPLETVKLLLDHGAIIGPKSGAMHAAAQGDAPDRIAVMTYLLEQGADINGIAADCPAPSEAMRAGRRGTPLHTAAKWGNEEARVWLLDNGADPEAKNEMGETPEQWGRRFEKDGPEHGVRLRRAIFRKHRSEKG